MPLVIPLKHKKIGDTLIVILHKDDWEKMKQADPVEISVQDMIRKGCHRLHQPNIVVCYEEDPLPLMALLNKGDIVGTLKYLERGHHPILSEATPLARLIEDGRKLL